MSVHQWAAGETRPHGFYSPSQADHQGVSRILRHANYGGDRSIVGFWTGPRPRDGLHRIPCGPERHVSLRRLETTPSNPIRSAASQGSHRHPPTRFMTRRLSHHTLLASRNCHSTSCPSLPVGERNKRVSMQARSSRSPGRTPPRDRPRSCSAAAPCTRVPTAGTRRVRSAVCRG